jgi:hypothetical protein
MVGAALVRWWEVIPAPPESVEALMAGVCDMT